MRHFILIIVTLCMATAHADWAPLQKPEIIKEATAIVIADYHGYKAVNAEKHGYSMLGSFTLVQALKGEVPKQFNAYGREAMCKPQFAFADIKPGRYLVFLKKRDFGWIDCSAFIQQIQDGKVLWYEKDNAYPLSKQGLGKVTQEIGQILSKDTGDIPLPPSPQPTPDAQKSREWVPVDEMQINEWLKCYDEAYEVGERYYSGQRSVRLHELFYVPSQSIESNDYGMVLRYYCKIPNKRTQWVKVVPGETKSRITIEDQDDDMEVIHPDAISGEHIKLWAKHVKTAGEKADKQFFKSRSTYTSPMFFDCDESLVIDEGKVIALRYYLVSITGGTRYHMLMQELQNEHVFTSAMEYDLQKDEWHPVDANTRDGKQHTNK